MVTAIRRTVSRWLVPVLSVGLTALLAAQQSSPKISPRDHVTVAVFGVEQLSGKFPVDVDGTLNYPLLGTIRVAGMTTRELEAELGRRLIEGGYFTVLPQVTADLEQTANKRVTVTGSVRSAGVIQYAGELTLLDAIVRAGNVTVDAGDEALVVRAPGAHGVGGTGQGAAPSGDSNGESHDVIVANLRELQTGNVAAHNVTLQDGDLIIVQRAQSVYLSGQVRSPGAVRIETGATVLQVLALAGGVSDRGTTRGIRIIRDKAELEDVQLDTIVKAGDTIIVRASPW